MSEKDEVDAVSEARWRSWLVGRPLYTPPGGRFSLGPRVVAIYGDLMDGSPGPFDDGAALAEFAGAVNSAADWRPANDAQDVEQTPEFLKSDRGLAEYFLRFANEGVRADGADDAPSKVPRLQGASDLAALESLSTLDPLPDSAEEMLRRTGVDPTDPRMAHILESSRAAIDHLLTSRPAHEALLRVMREEMSESALRERRIRTREFLDGVKSNLARAADEFQVDPVRLRTILRVEPRVERGAGSLRVLEHWFLDDADAFDLYARLLFLGPRAETALGQRNPASRGRKPSTTVEHFGRDLRKCRYCDRFFLKPKSNGRDEEGRHRVGRKKSSYCPDTECDRMAERKLNAPRRGADRDKRARAVKLLVSAGYRLTRVEELVKEAFEEDSSSSPEQLATYVKDKLGPPGRKK